MDVIIEEDLESAGTRSSYKVLYIGDRHIRRSAAQGVADWVAKGGTAVSTVLGGAFDEFNATGSLSATFGWNASSYQAAGTCSYGR